MRVAYVQNLRERRKLQRSKGCGRGKDERTFSSLFLFTVHRYIPSSSGAVPFAPFAPAAVVGV